MNLTREQALKIILSLTDQEDPAWEDAVADYYDEGNDYLPTIYDVLIPLGITKAEIDKVEGISP